MNNAWSLPSKSLHFDKHVFHGIAITHFPINLLACHTVESKQDTAGTLELGKTKETLIHGLFAQVWAWYRETTNSYYYPHAQKDKGKGLRMGKSNKESHPERSCGF